MSSPFSFFVFSIIDITFFISYELFDDIFLSTILFYKVKYVFSDVNAFKKISVLHLMPNVHKWGGRTVIFFKASDLVFDLPSHTIFGCFIFYFPSSDLRRGKRSRRHGVPGRAARAEAEAW